MKRTVIYFILNSLIKGLVLFISILFKEFIPYNLFFYFVIIGFIDWQMFGLINKELAKNILIKAIAFSYLSFIATLWITGPLFQLYNSLTNTIVEGEPHMPTSALVFFLICGLITSLTSSITWIKMNKKTTANNNIR